MRYRCSIQHPKVEISKFQFWIQASCMSDMIWKLGRICLLLIHGNKAHLKKQPLSTWTKNQLYAFISIHEVTSTLVFRFRYYMLMELATCLILNKICEQSKIFFNCLSYWLLSWKETLHTLTLYTFHMPVVFPECNKFL